MIDTLLNILGYSGSDDVIIYLVVAVALIFVTSVVYSLIQFLYDLTISLVSRGKR